MDAIVAIMESVLYGIVYYCNRHHFPFQDVIRYRIVNEEAQRDFSSGPSAYFQIDTESGFLSLIRSVKDNNIVRFVVSIIVSFIWLCC